MLLIVTQFFWRALTDLVVMRTYIKCLHMRNKHTFIAVFMLACTLLTVMRVLIPKPFDGPLAPIVFFVPILVPTATVVLSAQEPWHKSLILSLIVNVSILVPEFAATATSYLLTGSIDMSADTPERYASTTIAYLVVIVTLVLVMELIITIFTRKRFAHERAAVPSALALASITIFSIFMILYRLHANPERDVPISAICVLGSACCALTILLLYVTLEVARQDSLASQAASNRMVLTRQIRHMQAQLRKSIGHSQTMRYLRHDIANQVDVVTQLIEEGKTAEANRYLETLQEQTRALTEECNA